MFLKQQCKNFEMFSTAFVPQEIVYKVRTPARISTWSLRRSGDKEQVLKSTIFEEI